MLSIPFDIAGPGIAVALGLSAAAATLLMAAIVLVEAVALRLVGWAAFWRALLASLLMNIVSGVVGLFLVGLIVLGSSSGAAWMLVAFVASLLVEGSILMLMSRGQARKNWMAALVANLATYLPLGILFAVASLAAAP